MKVLVEVLGARGLASVKGLQCVIGRVAPTTGRLRNNDRVKSEIQCWSLDDEWRALKTTVNVLDEKVMIELWEKDSKSHRIHFFIGCAVVPQFSFEGANGHHEWVQLHSREQKIVAGQLHIRVTKVPIEQNHPTEKAVEEHLRLLLKRAEDLVRADPKPLPADKIDALVRGGGEEQEKRVVRVFISSTFTDTETERNHLMEHAFPFLSRFCSILGLEFQVVDMRWGIMDDTSDDHNTSTLCMKEIRKCLEMSLSISFVTILGNKYGYRPFPARIEPEEFEKLIKNLLSKRHPVVSLLQKWYTLDLNNIPPHYVLRPIAELLPNYRVVGGSAGSRGADYDRWWGGNGEPGYFGLMQKALRSAAGDCLDSLAAKKYIRSVTEEEVVNGIFEVQDAEQRAIFFDREYKNVDLNDDDAYKFVDTIGKREDEDATRLLSKEKEGVAERLQTKKHKFEMEWSTRSYSNPDMLRRWRDILCSEIAERTMTKFSEQRFAKMPLFQEIMHHRSVAKGRWASFSARPGLLERVQKYLTGHNSKPFIIHGESGSGKSSLLAHCAYETKRTYPAAVVVARFVGTSPESSDGRSLLYSVACQITLAYGNDLETVPSDYESLRQFTTLSYATSEKPLFVYLDSIDQLTPDDLALRMQWVPDVLPPHVHMVISTLPKIGQCLKILKDKFENSSAQFLEVPQLDTKESESILKSLLQKEGRTITPQQKQHAMSCIKACPLPLYIRLIVDVLSHLRSDQLIPIDLPTSIEELLNDKWAKLEKYHGRTLVSHALSYITAARNGLTMSELEDVLACDDEVLNVVYAWWTPPLRRLPPSLWLRLRHDLSTYLVERGSDNSVVYAWYHRQCAKVARQRYLSDQKHRQKIHLALAQYFSGKWAGVEKQYTHKNVAYRANRFVDSQPLYLTDNHPNVRKVSELPYHQLHSGCFEDMATTSLGNLSFISAKIEAGRLFELIEDFLMVNSELNNKESVVPAEIVSELQEYHRLTRGNLHVLARDPKALLQCALNHPNSSIVKKAEESISSRYPSQVFMSWLNKSPYPDPCFLTLTPPESYILLNTVLVSRDNSIILAIAGHVEDRAKVYSWDMRTGAILATINLHVDVRRSEYVLMHDGMLYCFGPDSAIKVYDGTTGTEQVRSPRLEYEGPVYSSCLSPNGKNIALDLRHQTIICDTSLNIAKSYSNEGEEPKGFKTYTTFVHFANDQVFVKAVRFRGCHIVVIVRDLTDDSTRSWKIFDSYFSFAVSNNGACLATGSNTEIAVWNLSDGSLVCKTPTNYEHMKPFTKHYRTMAFSKDSQLLYFVNYISLKRLCIGTEKPETVVEGIAHSSQMYWTNDSNLVLVADDLTINFPSIKLWDITIEPLKRISDLAILSDDGKQVIAAQHERRSITLHETSLQKLSQTIHIPNATRFLSLNSTYVTFLSRSSTILNIYSIETSKVIYQREMKDMKFYCFTPDFQHICVANANYALITKIAKEENQPQDIRFELYNIPLSVSVSHNKRYAGIILSNCCLLYDLERGKQWYVMCSETWYCQFTSKGNHLLICGTERRAPFTAIYNIKKKIFVWDLRIKSKWVVPAPKDKNVMILSRFDEPVIEWWTRKGQLVHRFHIMGASNSFSIPPSSNCLLAMVQECQTAYILAARKDSPNYEASLYSNSKAVLSQELNEIPGQNRWTEEKDFQKEPLKEDDMDGVLYGAEAIQPEHDESDASASTLAVSVFSLHDAVQNGDYARVNMLLEEGLPVGTRGFKEWPALHLAAAIGNHEITHLLLEHGADPNAKIGYGTPLHLAAHPGYLKIANLLIARGADLNARNEEECTPLHWAAKNRRVKMVKLLLEHGADPNAKNDKLATPLHYAAFWGYTIIAGLLISHGADPNARNIDDNTPLHCAALEKQDETIRFLLKNGGDRSIRNGKNKYFYELWESNEQCQAFKEQLW